MNKLLVICGPTATGKTELAFELAKKFNGELISADSRMIYKYMDIGTGKDKDKFGNILGYDLVNPNEDFSISQYSKFADNAIKSINEQKKLPIVVGGSGLYIKSVFDNIASIDVPQDENLRKEFQDKTASELFAILEKVDIGRANLMNESDKKNPRRLIRAIEVAGSLLNKDSKKNDYDVLWIGLTADKETLKERIERRVDERVKLGISNEIKFLKENGFWDGAPSRTLGYKDWPDINKWKLEEFKYAKRQMTWFKKEKRINWFNIGHKKEVENLAQKWYSDTNAKD